MVQITDKNTVECIQSAAKCLGISDEDYIKHLVLADCSPADDYKKRI